MSDELPPRVEIFPTINFNSQFFNQITGALTFQQATGLFLQFPSAQGNETTNYDLTVNGNLNQNGPAIFSDTVDITSLIPPTSSQLIPASNDSSTKIPTTAWVQSAISLLGTPILSAVLTAGNSAGSTDINMNNRNISALNTLSFATTSQNTAYTGGTPGTYTNVGMTLDANGKISSIASGTLSPNVVKTAWAFGNNVSAFGITFTINIPLSGSGFQPANKYVSFRLTFNQDSNISGTINQSSMSTTCILNLFPGRFNANWLTQAGAPAAQKTRGLISDNTIYTTTPLGTYIVNDATYCPLGRQFWCTDLLYTISGTPAQSAKLNISGGAGVNQVSIVIVNPNGYSSTLVAQNFNLSLELLNNAGITGITTTGFSTYGGVDIL